MTDWIQQIVGETIIPVTPSEDNSIRSRRVAVGTIRAKDITFYPNNPRVHPQKQRDAIAGSLSDLGQIKSIAINAVNGMLIDGHERAWQASEYGEDTLLDVEWFVLTEDEHAKAIAVLDWTTTLADYDTDILDTLLRDVQTDDSRVQTLLAEMAADNGLYFGDEDNEPKGDPEAALSRAEEWQAKYQVERGQIWQVGRHRIMCGDSYDETHLALLLDGKTPDLLHTDPPYGINIVQPRHNTFTATDGGSKPFGSTGETRRKGRSAVAERNSAEHVHVQHGAPSRNQIIQSNLYPVIEGDDTPFEPEFLLNIASITVLWGANYFADKLPVSSGWIVWDKRENITRNNFADCEIAWTNQNKPARIFYHLWNGLHKGSQHGERRLHPTEKPTALFKEIGESLSPKGLWLDLFAGAGGQLVAAEQSGATCYAMEYEPLYVATILERMSQMGLSPQKLDA